jgi:hypothetical protein
VEERQVEVTAAEPVAVQVAQPFDRVLLNVRMVAAAVEVVFLFEFYQVRRCLVVQSVRCF